MVNFMQILYLIVQATMLLISKMIFFLNIVLMQTMRILKQLKDRKS